MKFYIKVNVTSDFVRRYSSILRNEFQSSHEKEKEKEETTPKIKKRININPKRKIIKSESNIFDHLSKMPSNHCKCRQNHNKFSLDFRNICNKNESETSRYKTNNSIKDQKYCITDRYSEFYNECHDIVSEFNQAKNKLNRKINVVKKKARIGFNKIEKKEKKMLNGISENFQEFINRRTFKRKLINNLITNSSDAEKNYALISFNNLKKKNIQEGVN